MLGEIFCVSDRITTTEKRPGNNETLSRVVLRRSKNNTGNRCARKRVVQWGFITRKKRDGGPKGRVYISGGYRKAISLG